MGIDGIGKPPGAGAPGAGGVGGASKPTGETFRVDKSEAVAGTDPLSRLERGEIDVDQYLDARVNHAVEHLQGNLSPEQLEFVRDTLKDQMRSDPVLIELVRRSTGSVPSEV
jgi:hypothetical protein